MMASTLRYLVYSYLLAILLCTIADEVLSEPYSDSDMCDFYINEVIVTYPRMSMPFKMCKKWVQEGIIDNAQRPIEDQNYFSCKCLQGTHQL